MNRPLVCCLGVCHRDVELASVWLRWVNFLGAQHSNEAHVLLIAHTKRAAPLIGALTGSLCGTHFGEFKTAIVELADEDEAGYPRSASHLFLRTLEIAEARWPGHAVLWCEPDTVPLKPTWFEEIAAEYQTCGKPFLGAKVGTQYPHLAGNSVYPHNWRELAPSIANVLSAPDYKLWGPGKGQPWDVYCRKETTPRMAESGLWHHVWKERDARATRLRDIPERSVLFHQDKSGALIREIAAARYPEFMATLNQGRRFFLLNGHSSRLRAKGVNVRFSYEKYIVGGWRSAVCSTELSDENAAALAALAGHFGLKEITEEEFLKTTGRTAKDLPPPRFRPAPAPSAPAVPEAPEAARYSHPSVFVMLGRYGDICNVLPMLKAEADAGRRPTLVVSQDFADILDGVSYVDRIVWEGAYDRLPDALRWLRRDKGIPAPVVCQVHRNPVDKGRFTDSYQREVWRLAGRPEDFETRGPLVFDRRDAAREAALATAWNIGSDKRSTVIVGLESNSSPIDGKRQIELFSAIVELQKELPGGVNVMSVDNLPRAQRIYDLLGIYDRATVLVSVDTVHLHLSRGHDIRTVALLNDGWRGSVPNSNVMTAIRYADLTPATLKEAVRHALTSPLISMRELATIVERTQETYAPRVFHAVDPFGSDTRHHVAQSTWAMAYREGMTPCPVGDLARSAKTEFGDPRPLPFLRDILHVALRESKNPDDVIIWGNSDIGFASGAVESIAAHVRQHGAASMRRTESNGDHHVGRDLFAFTARWLSQHWNEFPDYVIGAPVFDLGLVAMIRKFHRLPCTLKNIGDDMAPADMAPGAALHQSHDSEWNVPNHHAAPSVLHNKRAFRAWAKLYAPELRFTKGNNFQ